MPSSDFRDRIRHSLLGNLLVVLVTTALVIGGVFLVNGGADDAQMGLASGGQTGDFSEIDVSAEMADPPKVGEPAPRFTGIAMDGNPVDIDRIEGPTWLIFNATWCSACRAEIPDIKTISEERGEEFTIVSVWVNEDATTVENFVDQLSLDYVHILDTTTEIAGMYRTMGVPSHYFIDAEGVLQDIYVGALSLSQMNERLDLIAE